MCKRKNTEAKTCGEIQYLGKPYSTGWSQAETDFLSFSVALVCRQASWAPVKASGPGLGAKFPSGVSPWSGAAGLTS